MLFNNKNGLAVFNKVILLILTSAFFLSFAVLNAAADGYTILINENFEKNYTDRGNVGKNITVSEKYDGFADRNKCGYMVMKQVTAWEYTSDNADRAGYNADDRDYSGYNDTYGKLGSALYLYPNIKSSDQNWWFCVNLGYGRYFIRENA